MPIVRVTDSLVDQHWSSFRDKLSAVPHPPRMDVDDARAVLRDPRNFAYVDTDRDQWVVFHVIQPRQAIAIPWWVPMHMTANRQIDMLPVLVKATDDALAVRPASATWALYGDIQGVDKAQSTQIAMSLRNRFRFPIATGPFIVNVFDSPDNPTHYARAQSTVGEINVVGRQILNAVGVPI